MKRIPKKWSPRKYSVYENLCKASEEILNIRPWKGLKEKYEEAIEFSHLKITPRGAFSLTILGSLLTFFIPSFIFFLSGLLYPALFILVGIFTGIVFFYLYTYPMHYARMFRIKASSEMALCVLYMVTSMKISPNLERAIDYTARHLKGPLAYDLNELLWSVYSGKISFEKGLDKFIKKWKRENEEFTEALYMIKQSTLASQKKAEKLLDEAIFIILDRTKERMKVFARKLRTPITVINIFGIVFPLVGVVFFPIMGMFLPEIIQPASLAIGYTVFLPLIVYSLMRRYLEERPYSFHQPDISRHPKFRKEKLLNKDMVTALLICFLISLSGMLILLPINVPFSPEQLYISFLVTWGIAAGVIYYSFSTSMKKIKLKEEIVRIESEFAEVLYQLGGRIAMGIPFESALKETIPRIKHLKISKFFEVIIQNIERYGATLERAVFDERYGAINYYPSRLIESVMKAIIEVERKGGYKIMSEIMISVSTHLKNINSVEERLKDMMSEETASMHLQASVLAPLAGGIVVALAAVIMEVLLIFGGYTEPIYKGLGKYGTFGSIGGDVFSAFINVDKMIPIHYFQIIVGIYMIEIVTMLAIFTSIIENGEETISQRQYIWRKLLISMMVYTMIVVLVYQVFTAIMPLRSLITG